MKRRFTWLMSCMLSISLSYGQGHGEEPDAPRASPEDSAFFMFYWTGLKPFLRTYPEWPEVKELIAKQNLGMREAMLLKGIISHYSSGIRAGNSLEILRQAVAQLELRFPDELTADALNAAAYTVLDMTEDKEALSLALEWSKRSIEKDNNPGYLSTSAWILYKMGDQPAAIRMQEKALAAANGDAQFQSSLALMQTGKSAWKDYGKSFQSSKGKADFSGSWTLDADRSNFGGIPSGRAAAVTMKLTQKQDAITIDRVFGVGPVPSETIPFTANDMEFPVPDAKATRTLTWSKDGNILTIFSRYTVSREKEEPFTYTREETYTLMDEGKGLLVSRVSLLPQGGENIKAYYKRS